MTGQISPLQTKLPVIPHGEEAGKKSDGTGIFGNYLKNALNTADRLQKEADQASNELLTGDLENLHEVMIATEQAQLSLQLTVQVASKVIQAYQEIYRMQI